MNVQFPAGVCGSQTRILLTSNFRLKQNYLIVF